MLKWKNEPSERAFSFSRIFDVYEIYNKHKKKVYQPSGIQSFEMDFLKVNTTPEESEECEPQWSEGKIHYDDDEDSWYQEQ